MSNPPVEPQELEWRLTEQRIQSEQLRLLGTAVHVTAEGIAILTPAVEAVGPRIAFVNDGFTAIFGHRREEVIGQTPLIFGIVERHQPIFDSLLQHVFEHRPFTAEATARRATGEEFELDLQLVPVMDSGQLTHWVAFLRDVTATKHQVVSLRHQATHDALTGLPNRTLLFDALERAIDLARGERTSLALMLMDLDRFKEVNDTFGHHFGDALLKQVAFRVQNQLHDTDVVARLGGDEFAIVLPRIDDANGAAATARRIVNTDLRSRCPHRRRNRTDPVDRVAGAGERERGHRGRRRRERRALLLHRVRLGAAQRRGSGRDRTARAHGAGPPRRLRRPGGRR